MNKEQQIEEMARDIFEPRVAIDGIDIAFAAVHGADRDAESHFMRIARHLYKKGYRKSEAFSQPHENGGEWISVDERLPEDCTHVIVCDEDGTVGEAFCYKEGRFEWMDSKELAFVTHWMPFPEPPDMKGGK